MTTWASRRLWPRVVARNALLRFDSNRWRTLMTELRLRGHGRRESGAFLLAERGSRRVERAVYLDDLDPNCLNGAIAFDGMYYDLLWQVCDETGLVVVADAHTHPRKWVGQSSVDRDNPMIAKRGHLALIVPNFAEGRPTPAAIGVHRYGGDAGWTSTVGADAADLVYVGSFA
jgi:hypothetical protein